MERYVCIHGHFYQPPRENPWLEAIEAQDSAYPYHDWNERIAAECYAPNALSRILDEEGRIIQIVNNYEKISFDFGPTLLTWMERETPDIYAAVLSADKRSRETFSGHGPALAQAYNHIILPLANRRDKYTQVLWGIRDFEHRFGRKPEGMWLPETAVDIETLDIMAEFGIQFTILSPKQAHRSKGFKSRRWKDVSGGKIAPTHAYCVGLPSGRSISAFFYDGPISHSLAFEGLLNRGEWFAGRLLDGFSESNSESQIVNIATDGESYGHHHFRGDMALAYALHYIESNNLARLTNYGEFLEKTPPAHEVEIYENSSWSCVHGVERWRSDCGCNSGGYPGWNQRWRQPLREALDWLRDSLIVAYEESAGAILKDPWIARDDYILVILDRSVESVERFLANHAHRPLSQDESTTTLKLLEMQRHAMLMYTSCGWFFDELSGIETTQVLRYAGRAIQLAREAAGQELETEFLGRLEQAKSNIPDHRDGRHVYEKFVKPSVVDLEKVCAHYAVSSLFEDYDERASVFCYEVKKNDYRLSEVGNARVAVGCVEIASNITRESTELCFGVLHLGDHNLSCGVRESDAQKSFDVQSEELFRSFKGADFTRSLRLLDTHFGPSTYSLKSLFHDERLKAISKVMQPTLNEIESMYRQIYDYHGPMLRFLKDSGYPPPRALRVAGELVLNTAIQRSLEEEEPDFEAIQSLLEETSLVGVTLDTESLEFSFRKHLERIFERFSANPAEHQLLRHIRSTLGLIGFLPFAINLWKIQNSFYLLLKSVYPAFCQSADAGDPNAAEWVEDFTRLGEQLLVRIE